MGKSAEEIFEDSKAAIRLYYHSEKDRFKLILVRELTRALSTGIKFIISIMLFSLALFFIFIAIAILWSQYLESYILGSLYTGLCLLGLMVIVFMLSKIFIKPPIMRSLIKEVLEEDDNDETE